MKIKNKFFSIFIIILLIIIGIIIYKNMIKNKKVGNNISSQNIVDNILNINSYKAHINVQVNSNKNNNKYVLYQEYSREKNMQEVIEPSNRQGMRITKDNSELIIENTNLQLSNIYKNYEGLEENALDLISFIEDYKKNNGNSVEEENELVLKVKNNKKNNYMKIKKLYINKQNGKPIKLIVQDNNQKNKIFIEYNDIELN